VSFEPSAVPANESVTVSLTLSVDGDVSRVEVPVPDAFTLFSCVAPAGWTCSATALGELPAVAIVRRDGSSGSSVVVELDLRTPTAGGSYSFGSDVLVVTGGFEGGPGEGGSSGATGPTTTAVAGDVETLPIDSGASDGAFAVLAAVLIVAVFVALVRRQGSRGRDEAA